MGSLFPSVTAHTSCRAPKKQKVVEANQLLNAPKKVKAEAEAEVKVELKALEVNLDLKVGPRVRVDPKKVRVVRKNLEVRRVARKVKNQKQNQSLNLRSPNQNHQTMNPPLKNQLNQQINQLKDNQLQQKKLQNQQQKKIQKKVEKTQEKAKKVVVWLCKPYHVLCNLEHKFFTSRV